MSLKKYQQKRKFIKTPEPKGEKHPKGKDLRFVVQEHHASRLHWDFRLEMEGVLKSWAVPKGPSMDPSVKHLAVMVEDHPYSYRTFEGTIPEGNYGAGTVKIWDEGTYESFEQSDNQEKTLLAGLKKGDLKFIMHGKKLKGKFVLVKFGHEKKNWLLIKEKDTDNPWIPDLDRGSMDSRLRGNDNKTDKKTAMPHEITPMLAQLAKAPFDNDEWVFELKWDGYRAIAEIQKGKIKLYSRNQQDFTQRYTDVVDALQTIKHDVVLDGEVVAVDSHGTPKFQLLQEYTKQPKDITLIYYIFDVLYLDGYDLREYPLLERKKLLKKLLPTRAHLSYSDHIDTHGRKLFTLAKKKQIEGIMAKKKDSTYSSIRSSNWLKIKHLQMQEAIICGFTQPQGSRKEFGALILGIYENGELRYVGHTGGGFDEQQLSEVIALLKPLITDKSPFIHTPKTNTSATWVKPKKVVQVKFSDWTRDGVMRQPVFLGLREDKKPEEVTMETNVIPACPESSHKVTDSGHRSSRQNDETDSKDNLQLSNLDKVFWPQEGYTKGDVIAYYEKVAPFILPYLKDRAESLNRHPDGIAGGSFYHKDMTSVPTWAKTVQIHSDVEDKMIHWLVSNDKDTLLYMANLGCIEINPWSSRVMSKAHPDYLIIDLDPNGAPFTEVVNTAHEVKKLLDQIEATSFVKTSGKTGIHILVPLGAKYTFEHARRFAEIIARRVSASLPQTTSVVRDPSKRQKRVYIDFLQNRVGQTIAAPYALRPVPGACVSTPLAWKELTLDLRPTDFTIMNIFKRLEKKGDVWKGFLEHKGIDMKKSLDLLSNEYVSSH
ncbi:MAG: DNA ligase D [Patescibacteria group bacterium]